MNDKKETEAVPLKDLIVSFILNAFKQTGIPESEAPTLELKIKAIEFLYPNLCCLFAGDLEHEMLLKVLLEIAGLKFETIKAHDLRFEKDVSEKYQDVIFCTGDIQFEEGTLYIAFNPSIYTVYPSSNYTKNELMEYHNKIVVPYKEKQKEMFEKLGRIHFFRNCGDNKYLYCASSFSNMNLYNKKN